MKKILCFALAVLSVAAIQKADGAPPVKKKAEARAEQWFENGAWRKGIVQKPSAAIDRVEFAAHYARFPERWNKVFDYLRTHDLKSVPAGQGMLGDDVKLNVQEYDTRNVHGKEVTYEKHNEWIDVQVMVEGRELHGTVKVDKGTVAKPYSERGDIAQYNAGDVPYYVIPGGMFSIFFPDDIHLTNIGFGEQSHVRKVVFKVKYN